MIDKDKEASSPNKGPKGKVNNMPPGSDIMNDSFFDALGDLDDGLGKPIFAKLEEETETSISDILLDKSLKLTPKEESKLKTNTKQISSTVLPTTTLPQQKIVTEKTMAKKFDPLNISEDDPAAMQIKEIWQCMDAPDASEYKLMVLRLAPSTIKMTKISGYLQTFHLPTSIPDIIEQIGEKYGGGKYQIRIVDGAGKYVKSKTFEISGLPKIPVAETKEVITESITQAVTAPIAAPVAPVAPVVAAIEDDLDDDDDDDFDFPPRRPRPMRGYGGFEQPSYQPRGRMDTYGRAPGLSRDDLDRSQRNVEERVMSKVDASLEKMTNMLQNINTKKDTGFMNPDFVKALAPLAISFLDNKSNRANNDSSQFSDVNKQIVGLMEGMQNLVRIGDKTREDYTEKERRAREDFSEKERKERESARKETMETQQATEKRFLDQQRRADERHEQTMLHLKETLESKHKDSLSQEQQFRLQIEGLRSEAREREDRNQQASKDREERLREEARKRDDDSRRKEMEFWEKQRQDEMKWRAELQLKEEEARRREEKWRDETRQKEVEKERELKVREMEMMKAMQDMNMQKSGMQNKLLEQVYSNNNQNRESQLQMEMAIARMTSDNESRMLQSSAEMQLEKIRHATQMQIGKMRTELSVLETSKDEDPLDKAMQDYLKRKLQMDMIKELDMGVDEGDLPGGGVIGIVKKLLSDGAGPMIMQALMGNLAGLGGMATPSAARSVMPGRVVAPNPSPAPDPVTTPETEELDDYEDESEDIEEASEEAQPSMEASLEGIDPLQEIPRVILYFQYLKEAIESGAVTPEEAANKAKEGLAAPLVTFITHLEDSSLLIDQIAPLLNQAAGPELAQFFLLDTSREYMDKMLAALLASENNSVENNDEINTKVDETKTEPKSKA